jgi:hypothetical protein
MRYNQNMKIYFWLLWFCNGFYGHKKNNNSIYNKIKNHFQLKFQKNKIFSLGINFFNQEDKEEILKIYKEINKKNFKYENKYQPKEKNFFNFNKNYAIDGEWGQEIKVHFNNNQLITQGNISFGYNNNFYNPWSLGFAWNNFLTFFINKLKLLIGFGLKLILISANNKNKQSNINFFNKSYYYDQNRDNKHPYDCNEMLEISAFIGINKYLFKNKWSRFLIKFSFYISKEEFIHFIMRFFWGHHGHGSYRNVMAHRIHSVGLVLNTAL